MFVQFTKVGPTRQVLLRPEDVILVEEKVVVNNLSQELASCIYLKDGRTVDVTNHIDKVMETLNKHSTVTDVDMYTEHALALREAAKRRELLSAKETSDAIGNSIRNSAGYQNMIKEMGGTL